MVLSISNAIGLVSFVSIIGLVVLYFLRPKPFKKVIPSLIFLESNKKQTSFAAFFRKFIKDWMFFLQLLFLLLLCFAAVGLTAELYMNKVSQDVVIVIDASASSNAVSSSGRLFDNYLDIAKKNLGVRNTIILAKDTPEIAARQTNPVNAFRILSTVKSSQSKSNIFDAMMMAGQVTDSAEVIVLSDFIDTNSRNPVIAKQLLEARGFSVKMVKSGDGEVFNIGIVKSSVEGEEAVADVRTFDSQARKIIVENTGEEIVIPALGVEQFTAPLDDGLNTIRITTGDNLRDDDILYISLPDGSEAGALFVSNSDSNNLYSALDAIGYLNVEKAEPPIVRVGNKKIYVLSDVDYSIILPGTIEDIAKEVRNGAGLIIAAQDNLDREKLKELLPVEITAESREERVVFNTGPTKFEKFDFGQSSKYYRATLKNNGSTVIAVANDEQSSPVIVSVPYGRGKVFFYGIFDQYNPFRLNSQYPLFWIEAVEHLTDKQGHAELNVETGSILYGNNIRSPSGKRSRVYAIADEAGFYEVDNYNVAANLLSQDESDISRPVELEESLDVAQSEQKIRQEFNLAPFFIIVALLASLFEIYIMK